MNLADATGPISTPLGIKNRLQKLKKKNSLKPLFAFGGVEGEVTFKATQRNQEAEVSIRLDHAQLHFYLS